MLTSRNSPLNQAESDYLEVLTDLIAKYESKWESDVAHFSSRELIQYLMVENDLSQKDLIPRVLALLAVCASFSRESATLA